jgi:phospholipase D-like protein/putative oligomerization/nucleic acid binding protein
MDAMTTSFGDVLLWSFWLFIWLCAFMLWFRCLIHLFQDDDLSGWAKAGWTVFLTLLPWVGVLVYFIVRGRDTRNADEDAVEERSLATPSATSSAADQIATAKSLLDSGTITQPEFDALKAKALA